VEIVTRGVDPRPEEGDRGGGGEKNIATIHRHFYHLYSKYIDIDEHCPWLKAGA